MLAQVADAYVLLDADLQVIAVNPAAERVPGAQGPSIVGRSFWDVAPPDWVDSLASAEIGVVLRDRTEAHFTLRVPPEAVLDQGVSLRASDNDVYASADGGLAILWRNATDRVALEAFQQAFAAHLTSWNQQLQTSADEQRRLLEVADALRVDAEAANRSKTNFLGVMSHELRTPLNAIGGYTELLALGLRGPITAEQREDLGRIQRNNRHLLGLIDSLLIFVQLDAGALTYVLDDVAVGDAVHTAVSVIRAEAAKKQLALHLDTCGFDVRMRIVPSKLQQVLLNLLSNAVKFTPAGGSIAVHCERVGDAARVGTDRANRQGGHMMHVFLVRWPRHDQRRTDAHGNAAP